MSRIKQMLDALMKTRTTPAEASTSAMPSWSSYITVDIPAEGGVVIAPDNGYYSLYSAAGADRELKLYVNDLATMGTYMPKAFGGAINIPVKKGDKAKVFGSSLNNAVLRFSKLMGGGKNPNTSMLYGGVLWLLNPSFKRWSRQHTEPHSQQAKALLSQRKAEQALVKSLRSTGTWHASSRALRTSNSLILSLMGAVYHPQSRRMQHHGVVRGYQSKRAKPSTFTLLDQVAQRFSLRNQGYQLNLVGGVA